MSKDIQIILEKKKINTISNESKKTKTEKINKEEQFSPISFISEIEFISHKTLNRYCSGIENAWNKQYRS